MDLDKTLFVGERESRKIGSIMYVKTTVTIHYLKLRYWHRAV
jgi:hypothetical protein